MSPTSTDDLYKGLKALGEGAFPKRCANCGRVYATAEEFLHETLLLNGRSGLRQGLDDEEKAVVELFRNCVCGSTLMDLFGNRRDVSERGQQQRDQFDRLLASMEARGVQRSIAREELRKLLRGEKSALVEGLLERQR